jgi:spore coat protein U-like protein
MTTAGTAGSRNVYGYMPDVPGAAGQIIGDSGSSAVWYRVQSAGQAVNLVTAQVVPVPATVPVGAIVDSITVTP